MWTMLAIDWLSTVLLLLLGLLWLRRRRRLATNQMVRYSESFSLCALSVFEASKVVQHLLSLKGFWDLLTCCEVAKATRGSLISGEVSRERPVSVSSPPSKSRHYYCTLSAGTEPLTVAHAHLPLSGGYIRAASTCSFANNVFRIYSSSRWLQLKH